MVPINLETAVRSEYSDISSRIISSLEPNISKANCLANSVLPTPVGPTKRKLPIGRLPSSKPARFRRIARATASTALSWPITFPSSRLLKPFKRSMSEAPILATGIPVNRSTAWATSFGVAVTWSAEEWSANCCFNLATFSLSAWAVLKSSFFTASAWSASVALISASIDLASVAGCWAAKWAAVTSIKSMALSGKERCGMYWTE